MFKIRWEAYVYCTNEQAVKYQFRIKNHIERSISSKKLVRLSYSTTDKILNI